MGEDTFAMRLMDENEDLWSFSKSGVRSYERDTSSSMPAAGDSLTDSQLDDLIAYLYSLRPEES